MKKILLSAFAIIAFSIISHAQFKVGIKTGGNLSKMRTNGESTLYESDNFKSYHAGLVGDLKLSENVYLQPQLLYIRKGAVLSSSTELGVTKLRVNYIDLGTNFIYKVPLGFGKVYAGAGVSFSYAINGTQEQNGQKRKLYSDIKTWKRYDISYGFTAGLELNNGIFVSINSQKGLLDINKESGTARNRSYAVSIGYLLDLGKTKLKD